MAQRELLISFEAAESIRQHVRRRPAIEQGGLLAGIDDLVICAVWMANTAAAPGREWECPPESQLEAVQKIEDRGLELVGSYHSHPGGNAEPSTEDVRAAEAVGIGLIVATHAVDAAQRPWEWRAFLPESAVPVRVLTPHSLPGRLPGLNLDRST